MCLRTECVAIPAAVVAVGPPGGNFKPRAEHGAMWIEVGAVTVGRLGEFVASGGYADDRFWQGTEGRLGPDAFLRASSYQEERQAETAAGLTWQEAHALVTWAGGRMPT